jgi:serine/threonine protein kinase
VGKSTGQRAIGEVYTGTREEDTARKRYKALFKTLKEGRQKNLIPFLESTTDRDGYMIISEYWQVKTLSELIEDVLIPSPLELGFIFAQVNQAVVYLHSQGIIHRNIGPETILVARGSPVDSRLTGFSEAISAASATEVVGHQHFRAPEISGSREYGQLVDVFSLSKVIQHCLAIQDVSNTPMDSISQKGLATDPSQRCTASMIQKEIDSMTDGNYSWPFQSLRLQRRFKLAWCCEDNDTYIRLSDLCQVIQALADPYSASVIPSGVRTIRIDDQDFPGQYCRLVYGERILIECGLNWHTWILNPKPSDKGVFSTNMDLDFDLYCHTTSQMFNMTTLLRTVSPDLARIATWDLKPQIQEVHGDSRWEGNYIDRRSFETVLERVQTTEMAVLPDLIVLNHKRIHTRFSRVGYSNAVIVVTRWLTPPWVLLSREEGKRLYGHQSYGSRNDLRKWCMTYGLKSVADRIDLTISCHPIP